MGTTSFQWAAVWLTSARRERICACVIDLKSLLFVSVDWKHFLAPLCSYSCILQTRSHDVSTHTHTQTQKQTNTFLLLFFCTRGKMKTSAGVRLKFISVFQAQAQRKKEKKDLTAHYFDKFGARDREEMEERGRKAPHAPNNR